MCFLTNLLGVLVICVHVFAMFCVDCTVFLYCLCTFILIFVWTSVRTTVTE
jgi:hypothetical protein